MWWSPNGRNAPGTKAIFFISICTIYYKNGVAPVFRDTRMSLYRLVYLVICKRPHICALFKRSRHGSVGTGHRERDSVVIISKYIIFGQEAFHIGTLFIYERELCVVGEV